MIKSCFILEPSDYEVLISLFSDIQALASTMHESDEKESILDKTELGMFILGAEVEDA